MSGIELAGIRARCRDLETVVADAVDPASNELRIAVDGRHARTLLARLVEAPETAAKRLVDLTAIDRGVGGPGARFEVVYRLYSAEREAALRVHAAVDESEAAVESVSGIWPSAVWLEREVFDLFGIVFKGHPDLRRLLLEPGFEGAPLRKDHALARQRKAVPGVRA